MRYYVIASDGQKYGPADVPTLQGWVNQGRVLHQTVLEEELGGNRVSASAVGALQFGGADPSAPPVTQTYVPPSNPYDSIGGYQPPQNQQPTPYQQNPYAGGANYYRPADPNAYLNDPNVQQKINNAWIGFGVGLACCAPFAIWGLLSAIEAKKANHPQAQAAFVCNIVALALWGFWIVANSLGFLTMFG